MIDIEIMINELKEIEKFLRSTVYYDYKQSTTSKQNNLVEKYYSELTGKNKVNWGCPKCAFKAYKVVGKYYFEKLDSVVDSNPTDKQLTLPKSVTDTVTTETVIEVVKKEEEAPTVKRKGGRPKGSKNKTKIKRK